MNFVAHEQPVHVNNFGQKKENKMNSRNVARTMKEIKKGVNISTLLAFILAIGSYFIAFISAYPNSSLGNGAIVNPYDVMNVSLFFFGIIVIFYIGYIVLWLYVKNSPPLVSINGHFLQDTAYLRLRNNEPVDLDYIQIKMGGLALGDNPNAIGILGHNNLLKIEKRIVYGEKIDIPIAVGKNGFTQFSVDDGLYNLSLGTKKEKEMHGKYQIALEIFAHPVDEDKSMLVGMYFGIITHIRLNGKELSDGIKSFPDQLVYQDMVRWEKNSFKKMSRKEYLTFTKIGIDF